MKKIKLHKVANREIAEENFIYYETCIIKEKEKCREKFRFLFFLYSDCLVYIYLNRIVNQDFKKEKDYFLLGLNAISEVCRLSNYPGKMVPVKFGELAPFNILVNDLDEVNLEWKEGIFMALIARAKSRLDNILSLSTSTLPNTLYPENTTISKYASLHLRLVIHYFKNNEFNNTLYEESAKIENEYKSVMTPANNYAALFYMKNLIKTLKALAEHDKIGFNSALIAALEDHKTYWQQTRPENPGGTPLCRQHNGFMSFELTAYAAIAHDRGWKLEVESDYMPGYMVDGSFLK